ncbi:uncharacterized protein LOC114523022 [Dendronephthya gigantea]|uniref:uncharacterized protein LOC114523022 n=1 Tax=Dendronephthya gigantea TaxID=151771 RepID=UPI00106C0885|nr:uncharacterized protein LOC114523022 [Dendronephthya gigantea]
MRSDLGHETASQVAGNAAEENISSTSEELGAKERPGVVMGDASSSVEQTSHILDPKDLSGSLQDDLISPQSDHESVSRIHGSSASPSCLPVMMEDSTILLRPNVTSVGLPSGLGATDTQELLYNVETADDLLQSLLNAENVSSGHVPVRNSGTPQDTSGVGTTGNATTQDVHGDPNSSIVTPSPCVGQGKDATVEISTQNNHAKSVNQTRTEAPTSSNETVTTSRLVTKRQRVRPKSRRSQLLQTQILDISSIPIASNIEIEQEVSSSGSGGIDHPVLELPVDLQEDSTQSLSKASKTSGEWGERFQQRRSRTSKVVLSRKRPESSGVHKGIGSGTAGDKTGTSRGTNSSSDSATIAGRSQSSGSQGLSTSDPQDSTGIINEITAIVVDPKNSAAVETENSLSHTNVQDLSTNDRVEIVLEVTGTAQGFANVVCESVHATNELNLNNDEEKQSNGDCRGGESVSERSNACNIDSSTDTSSSLGNLKSKSKRIRRQRASTPLHDVPPFGISLTSDATLSQSQSDTTVASTGTDQLPSNSSSSNMQDLSLNIPESAIEEVILNTNELLPGMGECPECPDLMFCLTAGEDTVVSEGTQDLSQTQPGTLEDNVANATRRTSAEFEEGDSLNDAGRKKTQTTRSVNESAGNDQTIVSGLRGENDTGNGKGCRENRNGRELSQGKEKTDNETTGGNRAASDIELTTSETVSGRQSEEKRGRTVRSKQRPRPNILRKRKAREKILDSDESLDTTGDNGGSGPQDTGVQDGSIGDTSLGDLSAPDASLGVTGVQSDTTQGNAGSEALLEGSTPEAPSDPVQDGAKAKLGSRKRQGKAIKPKIPAKRGRKKAVVQETTEAQDESGLGMNIEASEADENSMLGTGAVQDTEETSQKKKRGRAKSSKKVPEAENETEASSVPKTPKRRKKNQSGNASGQQDTAVNIASMKISDMISYNPMTNPMTSDNENDNQTQFLGGLGSQATAETVLPTNENQPDESAGGEERTDVCAPRVTIDADGNIVLDEESLFIASTPVADNLNKEVVVENANQQYNAIHKRKNSERWGKEETLYFYEVLSQIGTDFSLMAKLFPKRNRTALKKKFKREERTNRDLIDKALNQRIPLAASLFEECLEETEEEMERALIVQSTAEAAAQA